MKNLPRVEKKDNNWIKFIQPLCKICPTGVYILPNCGFILFYSALCNIHIFP